MDRLPARREMEWTLGNRERALGNEKLETDAAGNTTVTTATVLVLPNKGKGGPDQGYGFRFISASIAAATCRRVSALTFARALNGSRASCIGTKCMRGRPSGITIR